MCGSIYRDVSGTFKTPQYPLIYPHNLNCLYIIDTPQYDQLTVSFENFDVETSRNCYKDYLLTSVDGQFPSKYAVSRECGQNMSPKVFIKRAWFEFHTDGSNERTGFQARWKAETVTTTTTTTTTTTCKNVLVLVFPKYFNNGRVT